MLQKWETSNPKSFTCRKHQENKELISLEPSFSTGHLDCHVKYAVGTYFKYLEPYLYLFITGKSIFSMEEGKEETQQKPAWHKELSHCLVLPVHPELLTSSVQLMHFWTNTLKQTNNSPTNQTHIYQSWKLSSIFPIKILNNWLIKVALNLHEKSVLIAQSEEEQHFLTPCTNYKLLF